MTIGNISSLMGCLTSIKLIYEHQFTFTFQNVCHLNKNVCHLNKIKNISHY